MVPVSVAVSGPVTGGPIEANTTLARDSVLFQIDPISYQAAVYTDQAQAFVPVPKVLFRWSTWMNYVITEMDMRGRRQA